MFGGVVAGILRNVILDLLRCVEVDGLAVDLIGGLRLHRMHNGDAGHALAAQASRQGMAARGRRHAREQRCGRVRASCWRKMVSGGLPGCWIALLASRRVVSFDTWAVFSKTTALWGAFRRADLAGIGLRKAVIAQLAE